MNENMNKILIIDDEPQIRKLLNITLSSQNYKTLEAINGKEGIHFAQVQRPELILLDLGLPDINGKEVLQAIRTFTDIPVIILSVQNDMETIVDALNSGADDYITKPFETVELFARINVCLRRTLKKNFGQSIIEIKNLKIDFNAGLVYKDDVEVKLTSTEYDLLKLFIKHSNKILTTRQILKEIWGPNSVEHSQYPRVYLRHLRQKLENDPDNPQLFLTEAGIGYRLRTKD